MTRARSSSPQRALRRSTSAQGWRRPVTVGLAVLLAGLIVTVEVMLFRAYDETERATRAFDRSANASTVMANAQREANVLALEVERLPMTGDFQKLELRRAFLQQQLTVVAGLEEVDPEQLREIEAAAAAVDRYLYDPRGLSPAALRARLRDPVERLEREIKNTFDDEEHQLYQALAEAVARRRHGQRLLGGLGALALLTAIALAVFIRRSIRAEFARAYRALSEEVEERKVLQAQLVHQAGHDPLTDLPNRRRFLGDLDAALQKCGKEALALLYIDLDGFKAINDAFGHDAGDDLLTNVARRLAGRVSAGDQLARLGGDEFAVFLSAGVDQEAATRAAERLLDAVNAPVTHRGHELRVGASIGIALSEDGVTDAAELIRRADLAMYAVKADGKSGHRVYDSELQMSTRARRDLHADLVDAIRAGDQIVLHYQPIVELAGGGLVGVEALVRWKHPERGLLLPSEFLPLAEETGLAIPLGRRVIREACRAASAWTGAQTWISVNLSPAELHDPELCATVDAALQESGLAPERLVLELSERAVLHDNGTRSLQALKETGARLALDDFGAGKSALRWLQFLPLDLLKIDRGLAPSRSDGEEAGLVVAGIVDLAAQLGLGIVAEGIEHPEQAAMLAALGCELGQGYHFGPPLEDPPVRQALGADPPRWQLRVAA